MRDEVSEDLKGVAKDDPLVAMDEEKDRFVLGVQFCTFVSVLVVCSRMSSCSKDE